MAPADARDFLTLLWEATVTNTGGYYLYYRVGPDGPGLPAEIFGTGSHRDGQPAGHRVPRGRQRRSTIPLRAFHNTALVTDNLADPNAAVFVVPPQLPLSAAAADAGRPGRAAWGLLGTTLTSLGAANATTANLLVPGQAITVGSASHVVQPGDDILAVALALGVTPATWCRTIGTTRSTSPPARCSRSTRSGSPCAAPLQPGAAGFRLLRTDPDPADPQAPRPPPAGRRTRRPGSRCCSTWSATSCSPRRGFRASADGLPAGPARQSQRPAQPPAHRRRRRRAVDLRPAAADRPVRGRAAVRRPGRAAGPVRRRRRPGPVRLAAAGRLRQPAAGPAEHRRRRRLHRRPDRRSASGRPSSPATASPGRPARPPSQVGVALDTSAYVPAPGEVFAPVAAPGAASLPIGVAAQATRAPGPLRRRLLAAVARPGRRGDHDGRQHAPTRRRGRAGGVRLRRLGLPGDGRRHRPADRHHRGRRHAGQHRGHLPGQPGRAGPGQPVSPRRASPPPACSTRARRSRWRRATPWSRTTRWPGSPSAPRRSRPTRPGWPPATRRWPCSPAPCSLWARCGPSRPATRWPASRPRRAWTVTQLASANGPVTGLLEPGTAITPDYQAAVGDTLAGDRRPARA